MQFQVQQLYERNCVLFCLKSVTLNSYEILSVKSKIKTINPVFI